MNLEEWPQVPSEHRPKDLPHRGAFSEKEVEELRKRGYDPIDVLFLEGPEAVKKTLEGARLGLIDIGVQQLRALDLEATVYGLKVKQSGVQDSLKLLKNQDVDQLLGDIGKPLKGGERFENTMPEVTKGAEVEVPDIAELFKS